MEKSNRACSSDVSLNLIEHRLFVNYHEMCHKRSSEKYDRIWSILDMVQKRVYPVTSLDIPQTKAVFDAFEKKFLLAKCSSDQCCEKDENHDFIDHLMLEWCIHKSTKAIHHEMIKLLDGFVDRLDDVFGYVFINNLKRLMVDLESDHNQLLIVFDGYYKKLNAAKLGGE